MDTVVFQSTIAILGYHKIGEPSVEGWYTWNYVPAEIFEKHLKFLKENDWNVLSFETFLFGLSNPATLPHKSILITFDDGYRSNYEIALPILKKYNFSAVMFVPTAFVGKYNAFDADIFYEPEEQICSWEELIQLEKLGFSIQSHGINHSHYSEITLQELEAEIYFSKAKLEQRLNKKIEAFSFPFGDNGADHNLTEKLLNEAGYKAAFLFAGEPTSSIENIYRIPRIAVGPDTDLIATLEGYNLIDSMN